MDSERLDIVATFMNVLDMTEAEAKDHKQELVETCKEALDNGNPYEIEDILFDYGLELDYAEELIYDLMPATI